MEKTGSKVICGAPTTLVVKGLMMMMMMMIVLLLGIICVFPCHWLLLPKGGQAIFTMRHDLSACCAHEAETDTNESELV